MVELLTGEGRLLEELIDLAKKDDKFVHACIYGNVDTYWIENLKKVTDKYGLYLKGFAYCINVGDEKNI